MGEWSGGSISPISTTDEVCLTVTGQRHEATLGLIDYQARYYSPTLGRFISPDSIVPEPGSSQGFNRYAYAYNNPIRYNDPSGHAPPPDDYPLLQEAIKFFEGNGWVKVGDPVKGKSIFANGADAVFTQVEDTARVLAVEVKDVAKNVNLGKLGISKIGDYGGSIGRVARVALKFLNSSNDQLRMESEAINTAAKTGNLENALFTSARGVSQGAQNVFNGVYTSGQQGVNTLKSLGGNIATSVKDNINTIGPAVSTGAGILNEGAKNVLPMIESVPIIIMPDPKPMLGRYKVSQNIKS